MNLLFSLLGKVKKVTVNTENMYEMVILTLEVVMYLVGTILRFNFNKIHHLQRGDFN